MSEPTNTPPPPERGQWQPPPPPGGAPWQAPQPPANSQNAPSNPFAGLPQAGPDPYGFAQNAPGAPTGGRPAEDPYSPTNPGGWRGSAPSNPGGWQGSPPVAPRPPTPVSGFWPRPPTEPTPPPANQAPATPTQQFGHSTQFRPSAAHDPRQAFGAPAPASVSITEFSEPKSKANWIIVGVVALVIVVMIAAAWSMNRQTPQVTPTPTPTVGVSLTPEPSAVAAGTAIPFESTSDNAAGFWQIDDSQWTGDGLQLTITLSLTTGSMRYEFYAMDATDTQVYSADSAVANDASTGGLTAGNSVTGTVLFQVPHHHMYIVLTGTNGRQIATLSVKA